MTANMIALTETGFDYALTSRTEPLLIEFWAEGCGPCKALLPVLEQLADEYAGRLRVATARLDDAPGLAHRLQIMALPTLILFTNGREAKRITEAFTKGRILSELASFLDRPSAKEVT